jgi:hypothetical protein
MTLPASPSIAVLDNRSIVAELPAESRASRTKDDLVVAS